MTSSSEGLDVRHSVITGFSCWLATMMAFWLHCGNPWWAAISAWVTSTPDPHASLFKGLMRVAGTFAGFAVGSWFALELAGNPFGQAVAVFLLGAAGTYMRFRTRFSYAWTIGSVTAFILIATSITNPEAVYQTGHYRLYEIIAGVISTMASRQFLSPLLGLRRPPETASATNPLLSDQELDKVKEIAVVGGVLPVIVMVMWSWLNLPSLVQIIVTAYVTLDRDVVSAQFRATQRILGCLGGGCLGLIVASMTIESLFVWSVILFGGIFAFSRLHLGNGRWSYVGTQGGVAFILALVTGDNAPNSILPVINRIAGMISGVIILALLCLFLAQWQERSSANRLMALKDER
jgi:uncharacterized membrane protein YccC